MAFKIIHTSTWCHCMCIYKGGRGVGEPAAGCCYEEEEEGEEAHTHTHSRTHNKNQTNTTQTHTTNDGKSTKQEHHKHNFDDHTPCIHINVFKTESGERTLTHERERESGWKSGLHYSESLNSHTFQLTHTLTYRNKAEARPGAHTHTLTHTVCLSAS